jgi:hypothetical protein
MKNKTIIKILDFLEKKDNKISPKSLKFLETPRFLKKLESGIAFTEDELIIRGSLDLSETDITKLPDGLQVGDNLDLRFLDIEILPKGLKVGGDLSLRGCKHLRSLPKGLEVKGYLFLINCSLKKYTDDQLIEMIKPGFIKES